MSALERNAWQLFCNDADGYLGRNNYGDLVTRFSH